MGIEFIAFCTVLLVILVLAWRLRRGHRRNPHADQEPQLTTAAKHFAADMEARTREKGPRWEAPGQDGTPTGQWQKPRRRGESESR